MTGHDPLCQAFGKPFWPVTVNRKPFPCDCDLISKVRAGRLVRCPLCMQAAVWLECDNAHCSVRRHPYCSCTRWDFRKGATRDWSDLIDPVVQAEGWTGDDPR